MENYFDKIADQYADEIMAIQPAFYKNAGNLINHALKGSQRVLDIGNGGVINYDFSHLEMVDCADLYISQKAADRYRHCKNIHFGQGDILNLSAIADNSYDAVIVQTVLHHLAGKDLRQTNLNVAQALRECVRVVKPSGKVLVVESTVARWFEAIEKLFYRPMQLFFSIVKFDCVYQYSDSSLLKQVGRLGLNIAATQPIALDRHIWIMRKKVFTKLTPCGAVWIEILKGNQHDKK